MYSTVGSYENQQGSYLISARSCPSAISKGRQAMSQDPLLRVGIDVEDLARVTGHSSWSPALKPIIAGIQKNRLPKGTITITEGVYFTPFEAMGSQFHGRF